MIKKISSTKKALFVTIMVLFAFAVLVIPKLSKEVYAQGTYTCWWDNTFGGGSCEVRDNSCEEGYTPGDCSQYPYPITCPTSPQACSTHNTDWQRLYNAIQPNDGVISFSNSLTIAQIISALLNYIFPLAGLLLLLFLIIGGFRFMLSGGDPKAAQSARSIITTALIGFILVFFAYWLTRLIATVLGLHQIESIFFS